jgi:hypothetical protein
MTAAPRDRALNVQFIPAEKLVLWGEKDEDKEVVAELIGAFKELVSGRTWGKPLH